MTCSKGANVWSTLGIITSSTSSFRSITQNIKFSRFIRLSNAKKVYIISYAGAGYPLVEFLNTRGSWRFSITTPVLYVIY